MNPSPLDLNPYSFNAMALVIIGLASTLYMLRLNEKTAATRFVTIGLAAFTVGMIGMVANRVVLWGGALVTITDSCAVISIAAMIEFAYHYPQRVHSLEARLAAIFAVGTSLIVLVVSLNHAYPILIKHTFESSVPEAFWFLNPLTFLVALGVCVRRTIVLQREQSPGMATGWRAAWWAFWRPRARHARLLRNFSLALSLGVIQGLATGLDLIGMFSPWLIAILINLSLLLMMVAIVYASFDLTAQQPSLIIRLVGLSLVTLLGILGMFGLFDANQTAAWEYQRTSEDVTTVRKAVQAGTLTALPESVVYVIAWPDQAKGTAADSGTGQVVYARSGFDPQIVGQEQFSSAAISIWGYFVASSDPNLPPVPVQWRYGDQPTGSYYQYIGYSFLENNVKYEAGFSLAEMSQVIQVQIQSMLWALIGGSLFILLAFPRFFRTNLIQPLERLLVGVRQADAGNLDINVPVTHADEVGFLTAVFNRMTASLRRELDQRQRAEAELRQLNITLEQRVADRTRELEALYDVSAAAGQTRDTQSLLSVLLEHTLVALRSTTGFILLVDEAAESEAGPKALACTALRLVAERDIPSDWQPYLKDWLADREWAATMIAQREPTLIANVTCDNRAPAFMHLVSPLTLILTPLQAEGQALGVLGLAREVERSFDLDEIALLASIAGQIGVAVYADRLRQRAQQASVLEERDRLARDLHDSVTQSLYGLVTLTEAGQMRVEKQDLPAVGHTLTRIGHTARQAIREMRLFIHQLRPPELEQEGLVNALDLRLAAVEGRSDVQARLQADESIHLPLPIETALYHIAQEALNNSLKHAQARSVTVYLTRSPQGVLLEVVDDGRGFDLGHVNSGGMGLSNMRARADAIGATLDINSRPGAGTRVRVLVKEQL